MPDGYDVLRAIAAEVSNWGRFGPDDEAGTLNLITPEAVRRGAACVRTGETFPLGVKFGPDGPQPPRSPIGRFNPLRYMTAIAEKEPGDEIARYSDDVVVMPLQAATQWDALAHVHYDGLLYNGFRADKVLSERGAMRDGIDKQAVRGVTTRGVLLDVARLHGVDRLATGTPITPDDLDAAVAHANTEIHAGDAVLLRTGWITVYTDDGDPDAFQGDCPGLELACARWLRERDVALVAADNATIEVFPSGHPGLVLPVHLLLIRDMGMMLGEIFDLEALATACAADGRYDFMFCAQPLELTNAVGSPVNPLAIR